MTKHSGDDSKFRVFGRDDLDRLPQLQRLPRAELEAMKVVSHVLPFRVNAYVVNELIDWDRVPDDPIFQLTFPQSGMLEPADFALIERLVKRGASREALRNASREIQARLNPHPAGQLELNVPQLDGEAVPGIQHKYRETVLFFPSQGQTCHAYCSYCFRWPQFVGLDDMKFAANEADVLVRYLRAHPEVRSVLFTGGDPMIMRTALLQRYIEPILELPHITSIRIGTKSVAYWPRRFTTDRDAGELLRLFERVVASGRNLAVMGHYSHAVELEPPVAREALERIRATGAVVRTQSPIIRRVNDSATAWSDLWRTQVQLGAIPYYMFIARDTGARRYFEVPLARAAQIYRDALQTVSGLGRTVRGPSMSTTYGKVTVDGDAWVGRERVFVLRWLQAREPDWVGRPFFARYDDRASWFDELQPAFGESSFFGQQRNAGARTRRLPLVARDSVSARAQYD